MKKLFKTISGFSILELMVGLGISAATALVVMKITDNANKASKDIQTKDDIIQFQHELNQILSNPTNCELNLGDRRLQNEVFVTGVRHSKSGEDKTKYETGLLVLADQQRQTHISRARIKEVNLNSSNGNNAIVDLEVTFKKPSNKNRIGGEEVNRIIKLSASLCSREIIFGADINMDGQCQEQNQQLVQGPYKEHGTQNHWAVCEECPSVITPNLPISACHSISAGSGVNLDNLTKMQCLNMGGTMKVDNTCELRQPSTSQILDITFDRQRCEAEGGKGNVYNMCYYRWIDITDPTRRVLPMPAIRIQGDLRDDNDSSNLNTCPEKSNFCPDSALFSSRFQCSKVLKFLSSRCINNTDGGTGYQNLCYYNFECEDHPGIPIGSTVIQIGKVRCPLNDCDTENDCKNKRIKCEGEP